MGRRFPVGPRPTRSRSRSSRRHRRVVRHLGRRRLLHRQLADDSPSARRVRLGRRAACRFSSQRLSYRLTTARIFGALVVDFANRRARVSCRRFRNGYVVPRTTGVSHPRGLRSSPSREGRRMTSKSKLSLVAAGLLFPFGALAQTPAASAAAPAAAPPAAARRPLPAPVAFRRPRSSPKKKTATAGLSISPDAPQAAGRITSPAEPPPVVAAEPSAEWKFDVTGYFRAPHAPLVGPGAWSGLERLQSDTASTKATRARSSGPRRWCPTRTTSTGATPTAWSARGPSSTSTTATTG